MVFGRQHVITAFVGLPCSGANAIAEVAVGSLDVSASPNLLILSGLLERVLHPAHRIIRI
jgi:hypothetical protein